MVQNKIHILFSSTQLMRAIPAYGRLRGVAYLHSVEDNDPYLDHDVAIVKPHVHTFLLGPFADMFREEGVKDLHARIVTHSEAAAFRMSELTLETNTCLSSSAFAHWLLSACNRASKQTFDAIEGHFYLRPLQAENYFQLEFIPSG